MEQNINESRLNKRQGRRLNKGRAIMLLAAIIFLIAGGVYAFLGGNASKNQSSAVLAAPEKGKINVLVLGVDERDDDVGRSDTTFVVTIDTVAKKVTMLSIPRDTRVKITGHGWDKINHAYAFGGSKLSKESVENLLGIPIDYTVVMSFSGFVNMVDAIGGVNIDVDRRMYYSDPYDDDGGLYIDLRPGMQTLNGKTAIEYVRYRDEEGDIGRVARQQKFLKALMQKFTEPQIITKLPNLFKEFAGAVRTDMPTNEMLKLLPIVSEAAKGGLNTEWVSGTPIWIQDVSYWVPNIKELRTKVSQIQGIAIDERYMQTTERLANEYEKSIPREIKVADVPQEIKKNSDVDKQNTVTSKKEAINNKPKTEITNVNGQKPTPPNSTVSGDSNAAARKNTAVVANDKQGG